MAEVDGFKKKKKKVGKVMQVEDSKTHLDSLFCRAEAGSMMSP